MKIIIFSVFFLLYCPLSSGFSWFPERIALGQMGLDGALNYRLPIGKSRFGRAAVPLMLDHMIVDDVNDMPRSIFHVRPLYSFALKEGQSVIWESPTGERKTLKLNESSASRDKSTDSQAATCYIDVEERISISSSNGCEFKYFNGALEKIVLPEGDILLVTARGPWIDRIESGSGAVLLDATYKDGMVSIVKFGGIECAFSYDELGSLKMVRNITKKTEIKFRYKEGLLVEVASEFKVLDSFKWTFAKHTGWNAAFSSAILSEDGDSKYSFKRTGSVSKYTRIRKGRTSSIEINSFLRKGAIRSESGEIRPVILQ